VNASVQAVEDDGEWQTCAHCSSLKAMLNCWITQIFFK